MSADTAAPPHGKLGSLPTEELRLRCVGVPDTAQHRLVEVGLEPLADGGEADGVLVISTRIAPEDLDDIERRIAEHPEPVIVLAHTGGERLAADLVAAGAQTIVGEGNEEAILGLVDPEHQPSALLSSFERRFGSVDASGRGVDAATGLPDRRTFEQRVGSLGDTGELPRVALCKVFSDRWAALQPDPVVAVQRRRLATALAHVSGTIGGELHGTGPGEFGLVGPNLSSHDMDRLGLRLIEAAATFQDRGMPLRLIVGHAGVESTTDPEELLQLARRALEVAAADGARQVLGAEELAQGVSVTTELEAAVRLLDQVEPRLPEGRGHGERVGRMTAELARLRGWSTAAVARAQLAGHLHDAGRAGLPPEAVGGPADLDGELLRTWRTFPERTASLVSLTAGRQVAATMRSQRERWDGEGFPDALRGAEIPEPARLLAVAHVIDEALAVHQLGGSALVQRLRERAGSELDPEVVELAVDHLTAVLAARS
jgi:HD-GYP domain-containing protein (c-di-GMP phosphodiesterase class II)